MTYMFKIQHNSIVTSKKRNAFKRKIYVAIW